MRKWKNMGFAAGLAAVLFLGAPFTARADEDGATGGKGNGGGKNIEQLKKELHLTDDQVAKIKSLRESRRPEMESLQKQMKTDVETLRSKIKAKASEGEISSAKEKVKADREAMQAARKSGMEQMKEILTPEQQAKLGLMMKEHKGKWGQQNEGRGNLAK